MKNLQSDILRKITFILVVFSLTGLCFFRAALGLSFAQEDTRKDKPKQPVIKDVKIDITETKRDKNKLKKLAKSLIRIKKGDIFSPSRIQQSIDFLKQSNQFQNIHIESEEKNNELILIYRLNPFGLIKKIEVDGAYPLFERKVISALTFFTGDSFRKEELKNQEKAITELYKQNGFLDPAVTMEAVEDPGDGNFIVRIHIETGPYETLEKIEINGNKAFSDAWLKLKMQVYRDALFPGEMGRFIQKKVDEDVKSLTRFYREKSYADCRIEKKVERINNSRRIRIELNITEGPAYEVEFTGNKEFFSYTLKDELALFEESNENDLALRKSVRNIQQLYRNSGYLDVKVKTADKISSAKNQTVRHIRFTIEEGPQSLVDTVHIKGNQTYSAERIKKQMLTASPGIIGGGEFVPKTLEEDINSIRLFYYKNGYLKTSVEKGLSFNEDHSRVSITVLIDEGVKTIVESITVDKNDVLSRQEALSHILSSEDEAFREYLVKSDEEILTSVVSEKGYPHVKVKAKTSFSADSRFARIHYRIEPGPKVFMGNIFYIGNFKTKTEIIEKVETVSASQPLSLQKLYETQSRIRDLGLFASVHYKAIGLKEQTPRVDLIVDLEEKKPYYLTFYGGYDTKREFYFGTKFGNDNLFGRNMDTWISGEISVIGYRAAAGVSDSTFLDTTISAAAEVFAEQKQEFNKEFGINRYGASVIFSRSLLDDFKVNLGTVFEERDQFARNGDYDNEDDEDDGEDEFTPRMFVVVTPSIEYDTRDSFIRPEQGIYTQTSVDISTGLENQLDNFVKFMLDARYYISPLDRLTFALRYRSGHIETYGSTHNIPDDQLFFLGGVSSVRGFEENKLKTDDDRDPVGGRAELTGNLEARIDIGYNLELAVFYDIGRVAKTFDDAHTGEFRSSVGGGLRYITPIGPIGILYGVKMDRKEDESYGRFHLSFGYTF